MPCPDSQSSPYIAGGEPSTRFAQEERGVRFGRLQRGSRPLQIRGDRLQRELPDGDETGLGSLALDPHLLLVEVDARGVQIDELLGPQAAAVGQLEQGAISLFEGRSR